jgi:predicted metalloprotease
MRWKKGRRSRNVVDRRGTRTGRKVAGGGLGMIVIALIAMFLGVDPKMVMEIEGGLTNVSNGITEKQSNPNSADQDQLAEFVKVVLADTEDTWAPVFQNLGRQYREPKLVLFSGSTNSACGYAQSAMGPFYCPGDQQVYIDLAFYQEMRDKFGAPGDFAQAYVIAHEVGHHVQTLLGISEQVQRAKSGVSKTEGNALQVKMELQADCLSGVWANNAHTNRNLLEPGDLEEGLTAAAAIGDDTLQRKAQAYVVPESFTHGSAQQRQDWFVRGLKSGNISSCDTFSVSI